MLVIAGMIICHECKFEQVYYSVRLNSISIVSTENCWVSLCKRKMEMIWLLKQYRAEKLSLNSFYLSISNVL